jgi:hypothetical protein
MLMASATVSQVMCPLSAAREKPFACRGQGCAAFRVFDVQGEPLRDPEGAVLHYCGQVGRPDIAQVRVQFPKLFSTVLTASTEVL